MIANVESIDRRRIATGELSICTACGEAWRPAMLDDCALGCGAVEMCPRCIPQHDCDTDRGTDDREEK